MRYRYAHRSRLHPLSLSVTLFPSLLKFANDQVDPLIGGSGDPSIRQGTKGARADAEQKRASAGLAGRT